MGLLSSLFSGTENKSAGSNSIQVPAGFPELAGDTELRVYAEGTPLLFGVSSSFDGESLTIGRIAGQWVFGCCEAGTEVTVRGKDRKAAPFVLKGTVEESTEDLCRIGGIEVIPYVNQRDNFRVYEESPVLICRQEDEKMARPEKGALTDISAGGAHIRSLSAHKEGETLRLKIGLKDSGPLIVLGQIVRTREENGVFRYGVRFVNLSERDAADLTKALFMAQLRLRKDS